MLMKKILLFNVVLFFILIGSISIKAQDITFVPQDTLLVDTLGAEIVLSGKLPSERARSWRFAQGYLKKTGNPAKVVDRAISQAKTPLGVIGIKASILSPDAHIHDRIVVDDELRRKIAVIRDTPPIEIVEKRIKIIKPRKKKEKKE